jgi:hypothetical protein
MEILDGDDDDDGWHEATPVCVRSPRAESRLLCNFQNENVVRMKVSFSLRVEYIANERERACISHTHHYSEKKPENLTMIKNELFFQKESTPHLQPSTHHAHSTADSLARSLKWVGGWGRRGRKYFPSFTFTLMRVSFSSFSLFKQTRERSERESEFKAKKKEELSILQKTSFVRENFRFSNSYNCIVASIFSMRASSLRAWRRAAVAAVNVIFITAAGRKKRGLWNFQLYLHFWMSFSPSFYFI